MAAAQPRVCRGRDPVPRDRYRLQQRLFSLVDAVLFRPLPVATPDRLADVYTTTPDGELYTTSSYPDYLDLKAETLAFSDLIGYSPVIVAVSAGDRSRMALGEVVTGNYFQVLGVGAAVGRTLLPADDRPGAARTVMLSHALWVREYGADPSVIGRTMRIHGQPYSIVGVAPQSYTGMVPMLSAALWVPMAYVEDGEPGGIATVVPSPTGTTRLERRGTRWMFVKGRLHDGVAAAGAQAELQVTARQLAAAYPETNRDPSQALRAD